MSTDGQKTSSEQAVSAEDAPVSRERKMTEKGKLYQIEIRNKNRNKAHIALTKHIALIFETIQQKPDLEALGNLRDELDSLKDQFNEAQRAYDDTLESEKAKNESYMWFDLRDRETTECRLRLTEAIRALETKIASKSSQLSLSSRSTKGSERSSSSSRSRRSSARSLILQAASKTARLKAEAAFLDSMLLQEKELKRLQLEKEIAMAEAEERVCQKFIEEETKITKNKTEPEFIQSVEPVNFPQNTIQDLPSDEPKEEPKFNLNYQTPPFVPQNPMMMQYPTPWPHVSQIPETQQDPLSVTLQQLVNIQAKQIEITEKLTNQQKINQLPVKEPPLFSGDAFEYPSFVTAFDTIISNNVTSNKDRLYYLNKYTTGKANDVVKGFLAVNSENAYSEARKLMDQRFGNPVHVAEAYKTRLRNWPQIKDGDSAGLRAFSDFLVRCDEAVKVVGRMDELNSSQMLFQIAAKLPSYSGVKWCRHAHETQTISGFPVVFKDFVLFVKGESELANDPVFSPDALKRERKGINERVDKKNQEKSKNSNQKKVFSLATEVAQNPADPVHFNPPTLQKQCPLCEKGHDLIKCPEFKRKTPDERRDVIKAKRLCFGCLKPGHLSSNCNARLKCDECGKPHPSLLHGAKTKTSLSRDNIPRPQPQKPQPKNTDEAANANANVCEAPITTTLIVPVMLKHKDKQDVLIKVYALLDDGSDSTFVTESTLNKLGVAGPEIPLKLNTMHGEKLVFTQRVKGLMVQSLDESATIELPKTYSRKAIPSNAHQIPSPEIANKWPHLRKLRHKIPKINENIEIGLLIGVNCPQALKPREVILGNDEDPYAIRTALGWGIIGPANPVTLGGGEDVSTSNRIVTREVGSEHPVSKFALNYQTKEVINPIDVKKMFELDFSESTENKALSQEDKRFLDIVEQGIRFEDNHYVIPLPLKFPQVRLINNRWSAVNRMKSLKKRFETDETYRTHYIEFMTKIIDKGYAEKVPQDALQSKEPKFYINHHGVYNQKKGKIRVVFNCSQQFHGESLNSQLLQGPDLTNTLLGVLCRFRRAPIAIMADIESMFYQVKVPVKDRDLLRFLWWQDGDTSRDPEEYRMTVHIFGATSSPGCSNFALRAAASDNENEFGAAAAEFVRRDFYVDDGLTSVETVKEAVELVRDVKELCKRGGFNLRKFTSNSKAVLEQIPIKDRADELKTLDLGCDALPVERALGVSWCAQSDVFKFQLALKDRPCTRRGILSAISSIFDPLGFAAPVLLEAKSILQELCRNNIEWDDPLPVDLQEKWLVWKQKLTTLENHCVSRCYRPSDFGKPSRIELHHFSDASLKGYGQCSYLRLINESNQIHCSFVTGKARVTPLKSITVPRLELTAAVLSAKVSEQLKRELDLELTEEIFWTDSKVVLGYIANSYKRFHVYVANRIQEIQDRTCVKQWRYVDTKSNPADDASRGLCASELPLSKWSQGPAFLWQNESEWVVKGPPSNVQELSCEDPEVRKIVPLATNTSPLLSSLVERMSYFSDWMRAKKAVALCRRYVRILHAKIQQTSPNTNSSKKQSMKPLSVQELQEAETVILRAVQQEANFDTSATGPISKLDPYWDIQGVIRVGGRLKFSSLSEEIVHPIVVPKVGHMTDLLVRHYHNLVHHQGRGITLNEIRANGYWIIGASTVVSKVIHRCITCRKLRGKPQEQRMADLPNDRLEESPPFSYSAVDYFGPFTVKEGRKELKRYGVLFTCMASRAVHVETSNTLESDSFICALRRFICRRGPIRQLRSDQGTNFVGAKRELKLALEELDENKIRNELQQHECDWFTFRMNPPSASHMGGVWERQIRSVRNVLNALLDKNGTQLNDEALRTFLCEAEAIVNSRPLTVNNLNDPMSLSPLTPNHLLTLKTKIVLPPPGVFNHADQYCKKRWRRVQHLANEFWTRWKKEYLAILQQRQKWTRPRRNMCVGDIVIIQDDGDLSRNKWQLARVITTLPSADGNVRKVQLLVADKDLDGKGKRVKPARTLERPVQKLILLQPET